MSKIARSMACGLIVSIGLSGCMEQGGASVPSGAGADTLKDKDASNDVAGKAKKNPKLSNADN